MGLFDFRAELSSAPTDASPYQRTHGRARFPADAFSTSQTFTAQQGAHLGCDFRAALRDPHGQRVDRPCGVPLPTVGACARFPDDGGLVPVAHSAPFPNRSLFSHAGSLFANSSCQLSTQLCSRAEKCRTCASTQCSLSGVCFRMRHAVVGNFFAGSLSIE